MDHSGHSMGSPGGFRDTNEVLARAYWYIIAAVVASFALIRVARILEGWQRQKRQHRDPKCVPSRPHGWLSQAWATATAAAREMSYPQPLFFTGRVSKFFSPLPLGRWLTLLVYWTVLLCFLWTDVILEVNDSMYAYRWEKVGYRAAWISITQIPFIYLLSCKFNPITCLTGISYERFNWLHRWAARTVFLTVIVHWSFFFHQWYVADIVGLEFEMMPMVKYGFGAWSVIGWMIFSGFGFFRKACYELFVAQHIAAAATLLWLLYVHIPAYTYYNIWIAVAFLVFDWGARIVLAIVRNTHLLSGLRPRIPGYVVRLEALPGSVVRLSMDNPSFSWIAGQHAYINIPRLGPLELHPFTIANNSSGKPRNDNQMSMVIQAQSGFTKRLHKAALTSHNRTYCAFLTGPWGTPPNLSHHETIVLIASSTGASFCIPLLQNLARHSGCARDIAFHWIIRSKSHFTWFRDALTALVETSQHCNASVKVTVHVTHSESAGPATNNALTDPEAKTATMALHRLHPFDSTASSSGSSTSHPSNEKAPLSPSPPTERMQESASIAFPTPAGRPSIDALIRPAVEGARGETAVVVCGGGSITAQARTYVAALSDERAVHKGTGAQGVYLFTETYGW